VDVLDPMEYYVEEDLCVDCKYDSSFLCDKKFTVGLVDNYFKQYGIKVYVYEFKSNNLKKIVENIHKKEVNHHRNGEYFALQCTNFHCGVACECDCPDYRCLKMKIKSRHQPHCIKFFGLNIEKYNDNRFAFILGNEDFKNVE